jgi:hypothetical protein
VAATAGLCSAQQRRRRTPPEGVRSDLETMDMSEWFPVECRYDTFEPSPIDQAGRLDTPAGRHGFLRGADGRWEFEDGTPARFVGVGLNQAPPPKEHAEYVARWMAKYGINMVRTDHLVTWPGDYRVNVVDWSDPEAGCRLHEENMDRLDYFIARLAEQGIYTRLSMLWYRRLLEGDDAEAFEESVQWAAENRQLGDEDAGDVKTLNSMGITFFDPKVMQANVDLEKAILTHRNPYREDVMYGEDPAICMIEVTNEDSIFFYTIDNIPPYYQRKLDRMWGEWLLEEYASREALAEAWGADLEEEEDPAEGTVRRVSIWEMENAAEERVPRVSDQLRFYFEKATGYFNKTKDALRAAGASQPICGTGWQGGGVAYWPEVYSNVPGMDYTDRHTYWGGGQGWRIFPNRGFRNHTALKEPRILLSMGLERTMGMPFGISEWNNGLPNQWRLAAPTLMAFYGQSLGGWDTPVQYCHDWGFWGGDHGFVQRLYHTLPVNEPSVLCQYPALSVMLRRGDVQEGEPAYVRHLCERQVFSGRPLPDVGVRFEATGVMERSEERGMTPQALAAIYAGAVGKTGIHFSKDDEPDYSIELNQFIDMESKQIRSATGELYWDYGKGYATADTPRTQAAVGFLSDVAVDLGDCSISSENRIASILVVSWDGAPLGESRHVVITAVGRARNTGMSYSEDGQWLLDIGDGPVLLEGVTGSVVLKRSGPCTVTALDAYGYPAAEVTPQVEGGRVTVPLSPQNKAAYYDVRFGS